MCPGGARQGCTCLMPGRHAYAKDVRMLLGMRAWEVCTPRCMLLGIEA